MRIDSPVSKVVDFSVVFNPEHKVVFNLQLKNEDKIIRKKNLGVVRTGDVRKPEAIKS